MYFGGLTHFCCIFTAFLHTYMATQQFVFDVFGMVFHFCMVFTMVSEMYVWQKRAKIEMYVCMFGPETIVNIEQIWFYIQTNFTFQASKSSN